MSREAVVKRIFNAAQTIGDQNAFKKEIEDAISERDAEWSVVFEKKADLEHAYRAAQGADRFSRKRKATRIELAEKALKNAEERLGL